MRTAKLVAEFLATCVLTLAVSLSLVHPLPMIPPPIIAALTLGLFVYAVGSISGAHLNPAVTLGLLTTRQISLFGAAGYIAAQVLGALFAQRLVLALTGTTANVATKDLARAGIGELLGTFILVFVVAAVASGRVPAAASGLAVGGALFVGILIASHAAPGILNPAVALGLRAATTMALVGQIAGGILGALVFHWLAKSAEDRPPPMIF